MLPSIIRDRATALYSACNCDAVRAITVLVRAIKLMDDLPYSEYHNEYLLRKAVLEYLKHIAVKDMKVRGKWN